MKTYETLIQAIFYLPQCPEWAEWAAVDKSGATHVFSKKPVKNCS